MRLIQEEAGILRQLEAIDIENGEYVFWDANGIGVSISVSTGLFKAKLESVASSTAAFSIQEAFALYSKTLEIAEPVEGSPTDVWNWIQTEMQRRPRKRSFLSKLSPH